MIRTAESQFLSNDRFLVQEFSLLVRIAKYPIQILVVVTYELLEICGRLPPDQALLRLKA